MGGTLERGTPAVDGGTAGTTCVASVVVVSGIDGGVVTTCVVARVVGALALFGDVEMRRLACDEQPPSQTANARRAATLADGRPVRRFRPFNAAIPM